MQVNDSEALAPRYRKRHIKSVYEEVLKVDPSFTSSVDVNWFTPFVKTLSPLMKTFINIELLNNSAIPSLGIYPREKKMYVHAKTCMSMCIAALFIKAKFGSVVGFEYPRLFLKV